MTAQVPHNSRLQRITRAGTRVSRFGRDVALVAAEPQGRSAARLAAPMSTAHKFPKPTVSFDLTTSAVVADWHDEIEVSRRK